MRLLTAFLLATVAIAGCLQDSPDAPDGEDDPRFGPADNPAPGEDATHDHRNATQHLFAENATIVDHASLREFGWSEEVPVGAHVVAAKGDLLAVGVFGDHAGNGQQGFHLFRTGNGTLEHLSFFDATLSVAGDRTLAWSEDGQTVFLGYEGGATPGVGAVDVSDPEDPTLAGFWDDPQDFGSHTVAAGFFGGTQYVFSLAMGVNILTYTDGQFELVGKYVTNDEASIADAAQFISEEDPEDTYWTTYALRSVYGHDMNFYLDPETDTPLLLVAYGYDGAKILDLSQPSAPVPLGRFMPPQETSHKHYTHSITAERLETGELIVVVGSETFEDENQQIPSPIWILDATDLLEGQPDPAARPDHVGTWTNPGETPAGHLGLSVHFFRQQDGLVYLSHYHAGVWALDLRSPEARAAPEAFAYIMPVPQDHVQPPEDCCIGFDLDGLPMVFDVEVADDGSVYAADIIQGVTSLRFVTP